MKALRRDAITGELRDKQLSSEKEMSVLHSRFLIHWTGKDWAGEPLDDKVRGKYIERLVDDLRHVFYMQPGDETLYGANHASITPRIARTCFTEIKLSLAKEYATKYGLLGIGVDRRYVLERFGGPVFYVQSGDSSNIVENCWKVWSFLDGQNKGIADEFAVILGYLKNMSDKNCEELTYYDELEWRITHLTRLDGEYLTTQDAARHIYRIKIMPDDVKVVVFPDGRTKYMALQRAEIRELLNNPICCALADTQDF